MSTAPDAAPDFSSSAMGEITLILSQDDQDAPGVRDRLVSLMYPELKRIAERRMRAERKDHTLQPTSLVNEFYLHFARLQGLAWKDRAHFLAVASNAMRRVLVDHARARGSKKRGGAADKLQLDAVAGGAEDPAFDALDIHLLLEKLATEEPRMARVAELRYFGGLTNKDIGQVLGMDERTVKRDWHVARAWMYAQMSNGPPNVS